MPNGKIRGEDGSDNVSANAHHSQEKSNASGRSKGSQHSYISTRNKFALNMNMATFKNQFTQQ